MGTIRKKPTAKGFSFEARVHRSTLGGKSKSLSKSFKKEADARAWINATEAKVDRRESVSRAAEKTPFGEACDDYARLYHETGGKPLTVNDIGLLANIKHHLGDRRIAQIDHDLIQRFMDKMLETPVPPPPNRKKIHPYYNGDKVKLYAASTVRKHFFMLKKVLVWHSRRERYALQDNIFEDLRIPEAWSNNRQRRLATGERERVLAAVAGGRSHKDIWPLIIELAIETTAREQELILAEWSEIREEDHEWRIPKDHVKTGKKKDVPLSTEALAVIEKLKAFKHPESPRIFHMWSNPNVFSKAFRRLAVRAGSPDLKFHDLRHEGISALIESTDMKIPELMSMTGHMSVSTLAGYSHGESKKVAEKINNRKR